MDNGTPQEDIHALIEAFGQCPVKELIDALPIPIFVKHQSGIHVYCNERFLELLDNKMEEVIGHRIEEFAVSEISQTASVNDKALRENNFEKDVHYRIVYTDPRGKRRTVESIKCGFKIQGHPDTWVVGVVQDVTEKVSIQKKLTAQHHFMRMVIDNLPQLIYAKDTECRFTLANKATALLTTGQPDPARLLGKTDAEFFRPELWVKYYNDEQEVIRTGEPLENSVEVIEDQEGHVRWSNTTKIPLRDEKGQITGVIGIGSDFTQFKKSEEQLRLQATALESAADGMLITDRAGTIIWANSAMSKISGFSVGELIGKSPKLFKSGCHEDEFYRNMWRTICSGQTWKGEVINRRKDLQLRTDEISITPVSNEEGRITHFISICRDITDRELLRQEMSRIYTAVSHAKDGILLLSREGRPFFVNRSFTKMLGYGMHNLPATLIESIFVGDETLTERKEGSDVTHVRRLSLPTASGSSLMVEIREWSVKGDNDDYQGQEFSLRDLTDELRHADEQKMLEVRLRQAQKMEAIGQLAAGIAHEINNPIQFVGNNTTFLQSTFADLTRLIQVQQEALQKAGDAVDMEAVNEVMEEIDYEYIQEEVPEAITQTLEGVTRVSDIVKAMKDFSHPGTKNRQRTDINKAVRDAILVARNEWKYNADIETDLDTNLPNVICQAGEVNQVILNILVNAAHAINDAVTSKRIERGVIKLSTKALGSETVQILISDNGSGIPQNIQDRIFEPFFTTKEVGKGTGQGLAISYDTIVRKHGGRLTFSSVENEGTTFEITLPVNGKSETVPHT